MESVTHGTRLARRAGFAQRHWRPRLWHLHEETVQIARRPDPVELEVGDLLLEFGRHLAQLLQIHLVDMFSVSCFGSNDYELVVSEGGDRAGELELFDIIDLELLTSEQLEKDWFNWPVLVDDEVLVSLPRMGLELEQGDMRFLDVQPDLTQAEVLD